MTALFRFSAKTLSLLLISILLHLCWIGWGFFHLLSTNKVIPKTKPIEISILPLPKLAPKFDSVSPAKLNPTNKSHFLSPKKSTSSQGIDTTTLKNIPNEIATQFSKQSSVNPHISNTSGKSATPKRHPSPKYTFDLPPSANLHYRVEVGKGVQQLIGGGEIKWRYNATHYSVQGDATVLFIPLLNFSSQGGLDEYGLSPILYSEKKIRRAKVNTHFLRDTRQRISFSASDASYSLKAGAQDRASIVWQLAGIVRADPKKWVPGTALQMQVAGTQDAEIWTIVIGEQETITVHYEDIKTLHLIRTPKPGTYDQTLDIWLAPSRHYYPMRIRFTKTNGDYIEMNVTAIFSAEAEPIRLEE